MAHEWAHYRYGVQDEHGFSDDPVYSDYYDTNKPTSCAVGPLDGVWLTSW